MLFTKLSLRCFTVFPIGSFLSPNTVISPLTLFAEYIRRFSSRGTRRTSNEGFQERCDPPIRTEELISSQFLAQIGDTLLNFTVDGLKICTLNQGCWSFVGSSNITRCRNEGPQNLHNTDHLSVKHPHTLIKNNIVPLLPYKNAISFWDQRMH